MPKENIIVFCPHSDDEAISTGGTLLKYVKEEKKNIIKIVFSAGEKSHPHYRENVIIGKRKKEALITGKKFGIRRSIFFDLEDARLDKELERDDIREKVIQIIKKYKPSRIFCPSSLDPHKDHRAVNKFLLNILDNLGLNISVYSYEVWNIINEDKPVMYVDISKYFKKKIEIMKDYKTQWYMIYPLILAVYFRNRKYGDKINCKYAEKFYKVR